MKKFFHFFLKINNVRVAQLVEQRPFKAWVESSRLSTGTTKSTCKPRMDQPGQWEFKARRWWPHLPKVLTFNEVRQDFSMSFQDENSKKNGLRHLHSVAENGVHRLVGLVNLLRGSFHYFGPVAQLVRSRELIILRPLFESRRDYQWSNGGIGRRNALKMHRCKTCQFKSDFDYHAIHSARGHAKLELSNYSGRAQSRQKLNKEGCSCSMTLMT